MTKTTTMKPKAAPIERSWDGLRDALFDQIDGLRSGQTKSDVANSTARCVAEITKSVSVQIAAIKSAGGGKGRPLLG